MRHAFFAGLHTPNPDLAPYAGLRSDEAACIQVQHAVPVLNLGTDEELASWRSGLLGHDSHAALHTSNPDLAPYADPRSDQAADILLQLAVPVLEMCLDKRHMEQGDMLRLLQQLASTETWSLRGDSHAARQRQPWASLGELCKPVPAQKASRTCIRPSTCPELCYSIW